MEIRIFEAGKPAKDRAVDATFSIEAGKLSIGGAPPCEVIVPGLPEGPQAEVHVDGARWEIRNVGGGTLEVAGRAVPPGSALALGHEMLVAVGGKELVLRGSASKGGASGVSAGGGAAAGGAAGGPAAVSDRPSYLAKDVLKEVFQVLGVPEEHPALVVYDAEGNVMKRLDLAPPEEEATIGRHPENRLVLFHASVSKNHARVVRDALGFLLVDLGSRNGTEVNGSLIKDRHRLKSGDRIKIGAFTIRFVDPKAAVEDLAASVPDLRKIERAAPGERVVVGYDEKEGAKGFLHETASGGRKGASAGPDVGAETAAVTRGAEGGAAGGPAGAPTEGGEGAEAPRESNVLLYAMIAAGVAIFVAMAFLILQAMKASSSSPPPARP